MLSAKFMGMPAGIRSWPLDRVVLALSIASVGVPHAVHAAAPNRRVVVQPLDLQGEAPPGHRERLEHALQAAVDDASVSVQPTPSDAKPCRTADCVVALARDEAATHVMTTEVVVDGRDFRVKTTLWDGQHGRPVLSSAEDCEICGVQEVAALVTAEASRLLARVDTLQRPASVHVQSEPSGASVRVDGELVGTTPWRDELAPGRHTIEVGKSGYTTRSRTIEATSDVDEHVEIELRPLRADRLRIAGAAVVGVGAALLVPGITFAALHHAPVKSKCDVTDVNGVCPYRFDTMPYGAALIAVGAAGVVTGAVLLGVAARRGKAGAGARARLQVSPFGIGVRL